MKRVSVGISGGVDSAVAAFLLKQQGIYDVHGVFMQNWSAEDAHCPATVDLSDARAVCAHLNIPLTVINFETEYWDRVFQYFLDGYARGITPNPDVLCNKEIKFKVFLEYVLAQGFDYMATGHYVRSSLESSIQHGTEQDIIHLYRGLDSNKDQSYFLHILNQYQLKHSLFPVGALQKSQVRAIAKDIGLPNADKKDSTGICFVGERHFDAFLGQYLLSKPGNIESPDGTVLGQHKGLSFYTIGQRKGLGIGGGDPWYVVAKDLERGVLKVAQKKDTVAREQQTFKCHAIHWISGTAPILPLQCSVQIRYRQTAVACKIHPDGLVTLNAPLCAITPGQFAVFYQKDHCLGGGVIL